MAKYRYVHYLWKSVGGGGGGTSNSLIFVLFLENESNLEVNNEQGIYSSYRSIKSCIDKKKKYFNFSSYYTKTILWL